MTQQGQTAQPRATLNDALEALEDGDPRDALDCVRGVFGWPATLGERADPSESALVMARIGHQVGDPTVERAAQQVSVRPDDVETLYELGYALLEQRLGRLAAGVLGRAHALAPGDAKILSELACALEVAMQYRGMVDVLSASPAILASSFMCRYFHAFGSVMSGDIAGATVAEQRLAPSPENRNELLMAHRIRRMLQRASAVAGVSDLGPEDLRGWHWVTQGGVLTSLSPFGRDEGMNGRWAWTQDSHDRVHFGIGRLRTALDGLGLHPQRIIPLPDRSSTILGHAVSLALGIPLTPWSDALPSSGLLVAYDLAESERSVLRTLREAQSELPLFAHCLCWTDAGPVAPDITTLLYQSNAAPWESHLGVDPTTNQVADLPADSRAPETIAADILAATPAAMLHSEEDAAALVRLCQTIAGTVPRPGHRDLAWAGSPVPSAHFA